MSSDSNQSTSQCIAALAALEGCLESPVVPGELIGWTRQTHTAFETLRDLYVDQVGPAHRRQLAEIRDQDKEMSIRVANLSEEHEAILVEFERLGTLLQVYVNHVDPQSEGADEPLALEEDSLEDRRQSLVKEMLALVIRIRTHEKALRTWFVEAFQRDRGVAD